MLWGALVLEGFGMLWGALGGSGGPWEALGVLAGEQSFTWALTPHIFNEIRTNSSQLLVAPAVANLVDWLPSRTGYDSGYVTLCSCAKCLT
jgi:hypothetical protein